VRGLKYRGWTGLADFMGGLMLPSARRLAGESAALLVPVPLTAARRRERGFNQSELLAVALSRRTGWTVSHLLRKNRGGPPLARLDRRRREQAAEGAYSIESGALGALGARPPVLIVDDVITTGATGTACAEVIAAAGSKCLGIVSFARTNPLAERA
jgi:predicted amidophosphoribosyltransferase